MLSSAYSLVLQNKNDLMTFTTFVFCFPSPSPSLHILPLLYTTDA